MCAGQRRQAGGKLPAPSSLLRLASLLVPACLPRANRLVPSLAPAPLFVLRIKSSPARRTPPIPPSLAVSGSGAGGEGGREVKEIDLTAHRSCSSGAVVGGGGDGAKRASKLLTGLRRRPRFCLFTGTKAIGRATSRTGTAGAPTLTATLTRSGARPGAVLGCSAALLERITSARHGREGSGGVGVECRGAVRGAEVGTLCRRAEGRGDEIGNIEEGGRERKGMNMRVWERRGG